MKINPPPPPGAKRPPPPGIKKPPPPPAPPIPPHVYWEENHPCSCCDKLKTIIAKVDDLEGLTKVIENEIDLLDDWRGNPKALARIVRWWIKEGK